MRLFALVLMMALPAFGNQQTSQTQKQRDEHQSIPSPVTVNVTQSPSQTQKENPKAESEYGNKGPIWSNWALVIVAALAAFAGIKTLRAIEAQVVEMRKTGGQTDKLIQENIAQSESMKLSVAESTRLASAMEAVAKEIAVSAKAATNSVEVLKDRTAKQMRAYLTVIVGSGCYQERAKNIRFEGKPVVVNTGHTPAHNVRHRCKAAVLPIPLPADFAFPLPDKEFGGTTIGPQQNNILSALVDDFINDADVDDVKLGKVRGLYVWGTITYEDIFGDKQTTEFCQVITFLPPDNKILGYFIPGHSKAT